MVTFYHERKRLPRPMSANLDWPVREPSSDQVPAAQQGRSGRHGGAYPANRHGITLPVADAEGIDAGLSTPDVALVVARQPTVAMSAVVA